MSDDWNKDDELSWLNNPDDDNTPDEDWDNLPEEWQTDEPQGAGDEPRLGVTGDLEWRRTKKPQAQSGEDDDADDDFTFDWLKETDDSPVSDEPRLGVTGELPWLRDPNARDDQPTDEPRLGVTGDLDWRRAKEARFDEMLRRAEEAAGLPPDAPEEPPPDLFGAEDDDNSALTDDDDVPDWLRGADEFSATAADDDNDDTAPDWLAAFDDAPDPVAGGARVFTDTLTTPDDTADIPEWLIDADPTADYGDAEDWLQGFDDSQMLPATDEDSAAIETPDWLSSLAPEDSAEEAESLALGGDPDDPLSALLQGDGGALDLADMLSDDAPDFDLLSQLAETNGEPDLDLFAELGMLEPDEGESEGFAAESAGVPLDFDFDDDQLLAEAQSGGSQALGDPDDDAGWLREVSEGNDFVDLGEPVVENDDIGDLDNFLASISVDPIQPGTPSRAMAHPDDSARVDDLFGEDDAFEEFNPFASITDELGEPAEEVERPDFLRDVIVEEFSLAGTLRRQVDQQDVDELPDRLRRLHEQSQSISPGATLDTEAIAPLITGSSAPVVRQALSLTDTQRQRIELLRAIAEPDAAQEVARKKRDRRLIGIRLDYLLVTTLMLLVVIAPFNLQFLQLPELRLASPPPVAFEPGSVQATLFQQVDALRQLDYVLVAVEYGATATGELDDTLRVLLTHIMGKGAIPVIVGTNPIGLRHADTLIDQVAATDAVRVLAGRTPQRGTQYHVSGYIVGDIVGLRAFGENLRDWLRTNIDNTPSRIPQRFSRLDNFALVIVIAERADAVRNWSEQVAAQTRTPFGFAVGFSALPLARPYAEAVRGRQAGLIAGYADTVTYASLLNDRLTGALIVAPTPTPTPTPEPTDEPANDAIAPLEAAPTEDATSTTEPTLTPVATDAPTGTPVPTDAPTATASPTPPPTSTPAPSPTPTVPSTLEVFGVVTSTQAVNVRIGPGTGFAPIAALQPGDRVQVIGENDDGSWYEIAFTVDGQRRTGWIAAFLLTLEIGTGARDLPPAYLYRPVAGVGVGIGFDLSQTAPPPEIRPPQVELRASAERWEAITWGILAAILVIVAGNLIGFIRHRSRKAGR